MYMISTERVGWTALPAMIRLLQRGSWTKQVGFLLLSDTVRVPEKAPKKTTSPVCNKQERLLTLTLGWHLATPKEGHKLFLSGVRGIPERRG